MLGDEEHPISILFEPRLEGAHVKVVVRAGHRGERGLAGELTLRPEEWQVLCPWIGYLVDTAAVIVPDPQRLAPGSPIWCDTAPIELDVAP